KLSPGRSRSAAIFWRRSCISGKPTFDGLLSGEADQDLGEVARGDILLIARTQTHPERERDGIHPLNLPGIVLRTIVRRVGDKMLVVGPELGRVRSSQRKASGLEDRYFGTQDVSRRELLGDGRLENSRVAGRAVWIGRGI